MKKNKENVYKYLLSQANEFENGVSTSELAKILSFQRSNMSSILNQLVEEKRLVKINGRPVLYKLPEEGLTLDEPNVFHQVIGYTSGSMKNNIELAKASMLYPSKSLSVLLVGDSGTGRDYFAKSMFQFAIHAELIEKNAKLDIIDGKKEEQFTKLLTRLKQHSQTSSVGDTVESLGMLVIHNLEYLPLETRSQILELATIPQKNFYLVCSVSEKVTGVMWDVISDAFPVKLEFPILEKRPLLDRFEFVNYFFSIEAERMGREIIISSEILRCLMLYKCKNNIDQLKKDIQLACATAFMRDLHRKAERVSIFLGDFPAEVRKGFLFYGQFRKEIEVIIPDTYTYIFSGKEKVRISNNETNQFDNIYLALKNRELELHNQGLSNYEIQTVISESISVQLDRFTQKQEDNLFEREALEKIVGPLLLEDVENFVLEASQKLGKIFSTSLIQALALHLNTSLTQIKGQVIPTEKLEEIQSSYPEEFHLAECFLHRLEDSSGKVLERSEVGFITYFLIQSKSQSDKVATLVAMHGSSIAKSIVQVVGSLLTYSRLHSYDMQLDKEMETVYDELKTLVQQIDEGRGVLVIYDMGSLRTMLETISKETGIHIRFIQIPVTLIALETARRVDDDLSLEELQNTILDGMNTTLHLTQQIHSRETKPRAIVTLCMSGEGAAKVMKDYIEQRSNLNDTDVIALAMSDKRQLFATLRRLKKRFEIVCIVGTYNPHIFGIPFVSIATLYSTPVEQLEVAMYLGKGDDSLNHNYEEIYLYLKEQQPSLNISSLKRYLPTCIRKIKKVSGGLKADQEVGLFIHIAALISRLQTGGLLPENPNKNRIISQHKRLYYKLQDILLELEEEFEIQVPEDEFANIISIIKEI